MQIKKKTALIKQGSRVDLFLSKHFDSSFFTYRQIFGMLVPLILDQFFMFFISTLTTSLISSSGEASMAAVALVGPISMIVMSVFTAISAGGTVIVAQYRGMGNDDKVRHAAGQVMLMTFLVATVCAIAIIAVASPMVDLIFPSTDPVVKAKAIEYLKGYSLSLPAFSIFNSIFNVLRGVGATKLCLRLTIVINVIHLFASMLFINVMRMDIMGTALAFNIARIIGAVMAVYVLFNHNSPLPMSLKYMFRFDGKLQKTIVKMGIPFAIEQIFFNLGQMLCQIYLAPLGQSVVAANSSASSISNLFYGAGFGVSTLAITVIGQCVGGGDVKTARRYGKGMLWLGTFVMIAGTAIIYPFCPLILKLFNPPANTLALINQAIIIGMIPIPFLWAISYVTPSILRAAGDANYTSIWSLISMWIFRVGAGYILAVTCNLGIIGVWISMGGEWALRSLVFLIRFKGDKWLKKRVLE